jgi:hypothetical protein
MALPKASEIETLLRGWLSAHQKEDSRLEFKLSIVLSTVGGKAEFIRDLISLANSEGECPRETGFLVIGFKKGRFHDIRGESYDGATFSQIVEAYVSPEINLSYQEFDNGQQGAIGVIAIAADPDVIYVARKEIRDDKGKAELLPGQCWGRKAAGLKVALEGDAIQERIRNVVRREMERTEDRLHEQIDKLERESGAAFDVKRIRFEIEATSDPQLLERLVEKLLPYAREFGLSVKHEVLDALSEVTGRAQQSMPAGLASSVDEVLSLLMPVGWGGMFYPSREEITDDDQKLLEQIEYLTFQIAWATCRYLRDAAVAKVAAKRYRDLLRFTDLNKLQRLHLRFLENARRCQEKCNEEGHGKIFSEGWAILEEEIKDALDQTEQDPLGGPNASITSPSGD